MKKITQLVLLVMVIQGYAQTSITIDPATEYQTIWGLGGKGNSLDTDKYLTYIVDLLGVSAFRHYFDGSESGAITPEQINSGTFNFSKSGTYANFYKAAKAKGVTNITATCWSPPALLKQSKCLSQRAPAVEGGPLLCGQPCAKPICANGYNYNDPDNYLLQDYYDEYGKFLVAWLKDFEAKTTQKVHSLSIQNEPFFNEPYASALLYAQNYGPCLSKIRTEFTSAGLNTKFHGPEDMAQYSWMAGSVANRDYIRKLLWSSVYRDKLDVFSVHGYKNDGMTADLGSADGWTQLDTAVRKQGKDLWLTETGFANVPGVSDWTNGMNVAKSIFAALKFGKVNTWLYWEMDGSSAASIYSGGAPNKKFYALMHFYRFIRPGYIHIKCTESDSDLAAMAYKNGASDYTIIIINTSLSKEKEFNLTGIISAPSHFQLYQSTEIDNCAYYGNVSSSETISIPPQSVITLYSKSAEPNVVFGPSAPKNLKASIIEDAKITVTWDPASSWMLAGKTIPINGYSVYIDGIRKTPDGPTTKNTWTFTGLQKKTEYTISIYTRDAMNNQSGAATIKVTTTCSSNDCSNQVAIESLIEVSDRFVLAPNPINDYATVHLPDNLRYQLRIYNTIGNIVQTVPNAMNTMPINLGMLPTGIYFVYASDGNKVLRTRIMKN